MSAPRLQVVSGVIARCGRVLLAQRDPAHSDYGWCWESPGGKVELGEHPADALARELREELGVKRPCVEERLEVFEFDPDDTCRIVRPCTVTFYSVFIGDEKPMPIAGIGVGWFAPDELRSLVMAPANERYRKGLADIARASA